MERREQIVQAIAVAIEQHVSLHHDAADSAEGIRDWWLSHPLREEPLDLVLMALALLEKRGIVVRKSLEGVGVIYASAARRSGPVH
jgi:hypothetical protein